MNVATETRPQVTETGVTFRVRDPDRALTSVTLHQELQRPRAGPPFHRDSRSGDWRLRFARPEVDRMEYSIELRREQGPPEIVCDPANPARAPGPFGERSVIEWPGYRPPRWLDHGHPRGTLVETSVESRILGAALPLRLWSSAGASPGEELPLLVAHDGFDYADYAGLLQALERFVTEGSVPPMRAALLAPVERDHTYSASAVYARALAHEVLPALNLLAPAPHDRAARVGMGASLGALAMLHAHRSHPGTFGALFVQSGSYFRQRFDRQESTFVRFRRIARHVGQVLTATHWAHPIPVVMTCGTVEENLANNQATCAALARQGYDVSLSEQRDAHNWTAWRDALDPLLPDLLRARWGAP